MFIRLATVCASAFLTGFNKFKTCHKTDTELLKSLLSLFTYCLLDA